jgi:hypothetical protein
MKNELGQKELSGVTKAKERVAMLSSAIKQVKDLGITIEANAPIEGKVSW